MRDCVLTAAVAAWALAAAALPPAPGFHTVAAGDTLGTLCRAAYGSEHYAGLLALHDAVDPAKLRVGAALELPPLDALIAAEGIDAADILAARTEFVSVEPHLWPLVGGHAPSAADSEVLRRAAKLLERAAADPRAATGQLKTGAQLLSTLASRGPDANGYDIADVHRRIAAALEALVRDARARVGAAYTHGLAWTFSCAVRATAEQRAVACRSTKPMSVDARGRATWLHFDVATRSYPDVAAADAAIAALAKSADPNTGLTYAWDTVWRDETRVVRLSAPCLFSEANLALLEADVGATLATPRRDLRCVCGGGCGR